MIQEFALNNFTVIGIVFVLQLIFFCFYYFYNPFVSKIIGRRVCPTCFAVGSTWLTLGILKYILQFDFSHFFIALLLSQSVVGVSYLSDEFLSRYPQAKVPEPLLRFGIVIYGTFAVMTFAFINQLIGFGLFLPVIIFGFWAFTPNN